MYMGDPHKVAAIMLLWRYRAKPKSAAGDRSTKATSQSTVLLLLASQATIVKTLEDVWEAITGERSTQNAAETLMENTTKCRAFSGGSVKLFIPPIKNPFNM